MEELGRLLDQTLRGDEKAATELVHRLQRVIRRAVRVHLPANDPLRRFFTSWDISQSVLLKFLTKAGAGTFVFKTAGQLRGLLRKMATEKFIDKWRSAQTECRHCPRNPTMSSDLDQVQNGPRPDEIVAMHEFAQHVRKLLTTHERDIVDLWTAGYKTFDIGTRIRGADGRPMSPDAVRMVLKRALRRVRNHLADDPE